MNKQNPKTLNNKPATTTTATPTDAKLLTIQRCRLWGGADRHTGGANESHYLQGNLLEYPVTVVWVLGLWSFIAGGTLRGAERTHTITHIHIV